jgi:4-hydroxybenzoate polyprenyltransferase
MMPSSSPKRTLPGRDYKEPASCVPEAETLQAKTVQAHKPESPRRAAGRAAALLRLARPHQWIKNVLVLAALVFSRRLFNPADDLLAALAFVAFCALASFGYAVNDIVDREADRVNPEKCNRPLACGELTPAVAAGFAAALGVVGVAISVALGWRFTLVALFYLGLQFGYSLGVKRMVVVDVIAVAVGFVLRAFAGGVAIGVEVSPWLVFITFVLALFLALTRRRHELMVLGAAAVEHRGALGEYNVRLIDQMLAIVAAATLVGYMIYTASPEVSSKLGTRYQYLTVPFVAFGILRYLYLVDERNEGGDPARLLLKDAPLLLSVLLWIATEIVLLYF